jgi:hypothetical protein
MASEALAMNRGQSYATIGAILLAGVAFRGSLGPGTSPGSDKPRELQTSAEKATTSEGPWLASCRYWAAIHAQTPPSPATGAAPGTLPAQVVIKLSDTNAEFNATVTKASTDKTDCGPEVRTWGIPETSSTNKPEVHAIIAAIADPVHSHFALVFDRQIDSLMQAAADNHYLGSAYWLPWRGPSSPIPLAQLTASDQAAEHKRQEQPGLIILKYSPDDTDPKAETSSFYRVVYLFLVGESPAQGMDGVQLQNAIEYENELRKVYGAALSMESPLDDHTSGTSPYTMAFIGPRFSGSATSLRQALLSAFSTSPGSAPPGKIIGAGISSTDISQLELNAPSTPEITYMSFGEDIKYEENRLIDAFVKSGADAEQTVILAEDNTVFGAATLPGDLDSRGSAAPRYIRFPREISLLRNAQVDQGRGSSPSSQPPSPYLNLSLKDPGIDDTIPKFSTSQTPLSQEAQLMAIERQLQKGHIRYILITASNILDQIFLARELRRACPNATIVFYNGGDLLVERDVDNVPYIGSITVSPYSLLTFDRPSRPSRRFFSDSQSSAFYNAANYIFWWGSGEWTTNKLPRLAGSFHPDASSLQFPLMVTAVGADGYYPLGILNPCSSDSPRIVPNIRWPDIEGPRLTSCLFSLPRSGISLPVPELPSKLPSMFWYFLCFFLVALCLTHTIALHSASYWSPFTRDLAILKNDQPRRRAVYLHIGTSMLASMALVLTVPWFTFAWKVGWYLPALITASLTVLAAMAAVGFTLFKTIGYCSLDLPARRGDQIRLYPWLNMMAAAAVALVLVLMLWICLHNPASWGTSYVGLFFSYRCLHPVSLISPVVPVLFLLFAWYLWAMFQTARLRFSSMNRPRLPGFVRSESVYPLYVTDESLDSCKPPLSCCLYENIDCLLITRALANRFTRTPTRDLIRALASYCSRTLTRRFTRSMASVLVRRLWCWQDRILDGSLMLLYLVLFFVCAYGMHIQSLDRLFHQVFDLHNQSLNRLLHHIPFLTPYEWLIAIFFYPLVMIALTGWLRVLLIWSSLKDGLLEQLELMPFRHAFSRLSEVDWVTMLGQSGLNIRWRDMARSTESLRQLMNNDEIKTAAGFGWDSLKDAYDDLNLQIRSLLLCISGGGAISVSQMCTVGDLPHEDARQELSLIHAIERSYATFSSSNTYSFPTGTKSGSDS